MIRPCKPRDCTRPGRRAADCSTCLSVCVHVWSQRSDKASEICSPPRLPAPLRRSPLPSLSFSERP
eukprot:scaffold135146_cov66-Phaeocystis_antarctica.AAC.1